MISALRSCFFVLLATMALSKPARAQVLPAPAPAPTTAPAPDTPPAADAPVTLTGRVETVKGPLGGAVVKLVRAKKSCVTNAEGTFVFIVPADAGPFNAVATYTGSPDVPFTLQPGGAPAVVKLATPKLGKAAQKDLNSSIKRAKRDSKRSLRQLK
ncbi:hypothetical protein ACFQ48_02430 [Hymenobacter caeli]|uniref:Carboxypeptidase regulatory-like domain-containing protein n=1 Tax=Hymenobacter caeli TaxID=2735894 RepID=A0ABX2FKZ6_9BACT|nr:hypothetical protein [Hymenobacter caeli]NRT17681.1 hypothetical protein [Hymenobacter caeli]